MVMIKLTRVKTHARIEASGGVEPMPTMSQGTGESYKQYMLSPSSEKQLYDNVL